MENKAIIITGGTSGIGKACCLHFGKQGAKIIFSSRSQKNIDKVYKEYKSEGIECLGIVADASKEIDNQQLIETCIASYGKLDILISNAGISQHATFESMDLNVSKKIMETNFYGTMYCIKYALPYLKKSKGSIVSISSINGFRGNPARSVYSAAKFAINGFIESIRSELQYDGIHVLLVCPSFTQSNIRHAALMANGEIQEYSPRNEKKMMPPEKVAKAIDKGIRRKKRTILLGTGGRLIVFFNKWIPGIMDKFIYKQLKKEKGSVLK